MGSSSKKHRDKESRKRRHDTGDYENYNSPPREKRHKHHHKKHYKDKKREKKYASDDSDVVEVPINPPSPPSLRQEKEKVEAPNQGKSSDSLSIVETNKLRAKLGLKPLDVSNSESSHASSSTGSSSRNKADIKRKDDLGEFYHKPAENWAAKAQQEKIRSKLSAHKEKREFQNKLAKVKTLGQSDSDEDAESWVVKNRKVEEAKKIAEKRAKMLEELDAQFGIGEVIASEERHKRAQKYTDKNLRGLQVGHNVANFAEEKDVILTLKDHGVLDEEEDTLINVNMIDDERYKQNVENRKRKPVYNAYEDNEFDEFGNPKEKSLLSQYDEEIDGKKSDAFKIGFDNYVERKYAIAQSVKAKLANKRLESIGEKELKLASEYYNEEELMKFKKPKKKIRKIRAKGKLLTADDLEKQTVRTGIEAVGSRRPNKYKTDPADFNIDDVPDVQMPTDFKFEDENDDLLEKALHRTRKIKQRENVVAEFVSTNEATMKTEIKEENLDNGNIILNATAEFCRTLGDIPTYGKAGNRDETEDLEMDFGNDLKEEYEKPNDDDDDDVEIIEPSSSGWNSVDPNEVRELAARSGGAQDVQILDEEPDVSKGVGAALKMAMSKGYLDKEANNRFSNSRMAHLQAKHYSIEDKAYGEEGGERGGGRRERYAGPIQEFKEKETFKPNVKLEYIDDDGHMLSSKEAFRYLSHKFHGKGPGKNKVEKRIKKGVQEQLMKKMSSTDTPLGTLNMLQAKQKETQSPFVVLSGSKQSQSTVISKTSRR